MYNVIYIKECTQWYVLLYWAIDPSIKILFSEQRTSSFKQLHVVKILNDSNKLAQYIGYIDDDDRCWRRNVLATILKCW